MFNLSSYLEKFKHLRDPKEDKNSISDIIFEVAHVKVPTKDIVIQKNTIFIKGNTLSKSRIFLAKEAILAKMSESLPNLHITEII